MRKRLLWLGLGIAASIVVLAAAWSGQSRSVAIYALAVLWGAAALDRLAARAGDARRQPAPVGPPSLPADAGAYLDRLDSRLQLPAHVRSEIRIEIAGHIEDSIGALEAEGLDPERATREALARLGRPEELAGQIERAHRTTRRLIAGAAGGVFSAGVGIVEGYLFAILGAIVVLMALAAAGAAAQKAGLSIVIDLTDAGVGTIFGCLLAWVAAFVAAHRAVRASGQGSRRPVRQLAPAWALAGGALLLWLVLFVVDMGQSWLSVPFELGIPLAFAAGAFVGNERSAPVVPARLFIAVGVVVLLAPILLMSVATSSGSGWSFSYTEESLQLDHVAPAWPTAERPIASGGAIINGPTADVRWTLVDTGLFARFHDVSAEVWRGAPFPGRPAGSSFAIVDTRYRSPYVTYPVSFAGNAADTHVDVGHSRTTSWWVVLVGVGPDGRRYRLGDTGPVDSRFSGTLWDWLSATG